MNILKRFAGACLLMGVLLLAPAFCHNQVWAASSQVYFDSESYEVGGEEEFQITLTIECDEQPGTYVVELIYDNGRMDYLSGADVGSNGVIKMQGTAVSPIIQYVLTFQPLSGGNAGIYVSNASVTEADGQTPMTILSTGTASIKIDGEDTTGKMDFSFDADSASVQGINLPIVGKAMIDEGTEYSIINLAEYVPEICNFDYQTQIDKIGNREITVLTDSEGLLSLVYLVDPQGNFYLYSYGQDGELYPVSEGQNAAGEYYYYMSPYASTQWPADLTPEQADADNIFIVLRQSGELSFCREGKDGTAIDWNAVEEETTEEEEQRTLLGKRGYLLEYSGFIIFGIVVLCWIIGGITGSKKRKKQLAAEQLLHTLPNEDAWSNAVKRPIPTVTTVSPTDDTDIPAGPSAQTTDSDETTVSKQAMDSRQTASAMQKKPAKQPASVEILSVKMEEHTDAPEDIIIPEINIDDMSEDGKEEDDNLDQLANQLEEILGSLNDLGDNK